MSYLALSESLDVVSVSHSVQLNMGTTPVAFAITRDALIDLGDHHGLRGTEADVFARAWSADRANRKGKISC